MPNYRVSWHHRILADVLTKMANFEPGYEKVIITTPPRAGKSELASRSLPAFFMGRNPDMEMIHASYNQDLINAMSRDVQRVIDTPEFTDVFPDFKFGERQANEEFKTKAGGVYLAKGVGAGITGRGANLIIVDDYCKSREEARSEAFRDRLWGWFNDDLMTRRVYPNSVLVMATRWHYDDLIGRILEHEPDDWLVIHMPYIYDWEDGDGPEWDPRSKGEPLWPGRLINPAREHMDGMAPATENSRYVGIEELKEREVKDFNAIKKRNPETADALYQGRPVPKEGGMYQRAWVQWYITPPDQVAEACNHVMMSVDATFKKTKDSDKVAINVYGRTASGDIMVLDDLHEKMTFTETKRAIKAMVSKWPMATVMIEDKANGPALIDILKAELPVRVIPFDPTPHGSKDARAEVGATWWEAGKVFLPLPKHCPWVLDFIEDFCGYPGRPYDDRIDTFL